MTKLHTRIFMGFLAALFLLTSSALTIGVIWQSTHSSSASNANTDQAKPKETKIQGFVPTSQPQAKLQIIDIKKGTWPTVQPGATVTADYTGALMKTGVVFDASSRHGGATSFPLSGVIPGWSQGIPGMKVGGTRRLLIPASLAYGTNPPPGSGIPANADLVFDVTVTKIGK